MEARFAVAGRGRRPPVALLLLALMTLPAPAAADVCPAPQAEPLTMCGTTVVSGAGGTAVSVRLPEDAVLNGKVGGFIDRFVDIELEG
ncbi:MAG: hypothetical protein ACRDH9_06145, partial [Actinomycetota bacterium]